MQANSRGGIEEKVGNALRSSDGWLATLVRGRADRSAALASAWKAIQMRITEDRYRYHRRSLDLAWRLIGHEARTRTISRWTQLTGHRIRALYNSYSSQQPKRAIRHRGMSPYKLESILNSPKLRCEGAMLAAICRFLNVLPAARMDDPEQALPSIERGELLCEAYEWFRFDVPDTRLTFEHALLLVNELARGELVLLGRCRTCRGVILLDRLSTRRLHCVFCSTGLRSDERVPGPEPAALVCERASVQQACPGQSAPHQLSCFED